jgi:hypothetical protein
MVNRVKKMERWTGAISDASKTLLGKNLSRAISDKAVGTVEAYPTSALVPMKNGSKGVIKRKTVPALLHKGEVVMTASEVKMLKKILK